jgi:hypothetical protein
MDVERYRAMGAQGHGPVQLDLAHANAAGVNQLNALSQLRRQASGQAASSAEILANRANQNAIAQSGQQVTSAKSTGSALAALRNGAPSAMGQAMAANAQNASARAAEISKAQSTYAGSANQTMGQDVAQATTNAQLAAQTRALNEKRQQDFERRAFDVRKTEMGAANDAIKLQRQKDQDETAAKRDQESRDMKRATTGLSMGLGALFSDSRTKDHVIPVGSLSSLMLGRR